MAFNQCGGLYKSHLFELATDINLYLHSFVQSNSIFIDYATFDYVSHNRLIYKMKLIKIVGKVVNWVKEYLSNRQKAVVINNAHSSFQPVIFGVALGFVLGLTLFLNYVNDIDQGVHSRTRLYVGDCVLH